MKRKKVILTAVLTSSVLLTTGIEIKANSEAVAPVVEDKPIENVEKEIPVPRTKAEVKEEKPIVEDKPVVVEQPKAEVKKEVKEEKPAVVEQPKVEVKEEVKEEKQKVKELTKTGIEDNLFLSYFGVILLMFAVVLRKLKVR